MAWAGANAGWGNPLANLCLPFLLALGITLWNGSLYIIKCFPGILDCSIGCFSFGHGMPFVFHLHGLIQHGHSFLQQSLWAFFFLSKSSTSLSSASPSPLSSLCLLLFHDLSLLLLLPFFIACMRWADAVSYIFGEGQPVRFTPILGYVGWNRTQAIDGWHVQPRSVACQQQLVFAKSSLYICIVMVTGESNSCQFHESWVLSFSCGSCHLSNFTPVHINSFIWLS